MALFSMGDLVAFTYKGKYSRVRYPTAFILHPNYRHSNDKRAYTHALAFHALSDQEVNLFRVVINADFANEYADDLVKENPTLQRSLDDLARGLPKSSLESKGENEHPLVPYYRSLNIHSPLDFYNRFIKKFINMVGEDPYRRYIPENMNGVRILKRSAMMLGKIREGAKKGPWQKFTEEFQYKNGGGKLIV
jgi:hypothetical protein